MISSYMSPRQQQTTAMNIASTYDVCDEPVDHHCGHILADNDAQDLHVLQVGRELVVRDDPALRAQEDLHPLLLDVGVLLPELVGEPE